MENITILNLSEAELKEVSFPKPLKLSREKLEKLKEDSRKINEPVVEQPVYEEPVQATEPVIKEINNIEETTHEWNNPGYRYKEPNPIPSYTVSYQQPTTKKSPSQADIIDKINTQKAPEIKGPEYYMGLDKSKFGKTANRILTSEVPELDKFIRLLEKLKLQLEDLKS